MTFIVSMHVSPKTVYWGNALRPGGTALEKSLRGIFVILIEGNGNFGEEQTFKLDVAKVDSIVRPRGWRGLAAKDLD